MAFDVLPRNVDEAAEDPVAAGGGLGRVRELGDSGEGEEVAAGGLPAHAWGRGACDKGAAVLRGVRQGSWQEHVLPASYGVRF